MMVEPGAGGVERFFRRVDRRVLQLVAERCERDVRVVIHEEDRSAVHDAALRPDVAPHFLHRGVEHLQVEDARGLDVEQLRERPAGVVVRRLLRIVRAPVLIVEQRVRDAAVRLIHADDVGAGGEGAAHRRGRRVPVPCILPLPPILPVLPNVGAAWLTLA
jgi:hypothetical protein